MQFGAAWSSLERSLGSRGAREVGNAAENRLAIALNRRSTMILQRLLEKRLNLSGTSRESAGPEGNEEARPRDWRGGIERMKTEAAVEPEERRWRPTKTAGRGDRGVSRN